MKYLGLLTKLQLVLLLLLKINMPNVDNLVKKKLTTTQKLIKLKRKLQILIMINILPLQNLIGLQQKFLLQD